MRKGVKYALFFTGGVAIGIGVCAANLISYVLSDEDIRECVKTKISKKIDKALFGEIQKRNKWNYVSYRDIYEKRKESTFVDSIDNIIFETRLEADIAIEYMREILDVYGVVTVADVCDIANVACDYKNTEYGWTDIGSAEVIGVRNGFYIKLQRPHLILIKQEA